MKRIWCLLFGHRWVETQPTAMNKWYACARCQMLRCERGAMLPKGWNDDAA